MLFSPVVFSTCCEKALQFRICACAFYWQKCELTISGAFIFSRCANMIVSISVAPNSLNYFIGLKPNLSKGFHRFLQRNQQTLAKKVGVFGTKNKPFGVLIYRLFFLSEFIFLNSIVKNCSKTALHDWALACKFLEGLALSLGQDLWVDKQT